MPSRNSERASNRSALRRPVESGLTPAIGVMNHPGARSARQHRRVQRVHHQLGARNCTHRPAHDAQSRSSGYRPNLSPTGFRWEMLASRNVVHGVGSCRTRTYHQLIKRAARGLSHIGDTCLDCVCDEGRGHGGVWGSPGLAVIFRLGYPPWCASTLSRMYDPCSPSCPVPHEDRRRTPLRVVGELGEPRCSTPGRCRPRASYVVPFAPAGGAPRKSRRRRVRPLTDAVCGSPCWHALEEPRTIPARFTHP